MNGFYEERVVGIVSWKSMLMLWQIVATGQLWYKKHFAKQNVLPNDDCLVVWYMHTLYNVTLLNPCSRW